MTLYNINTELAAALANIEAAIDPDTGELPEDYADYIERLNMAREDAIEGLALEYKNRIAEAKACRAEAAALTDRARKLEAGAENIMAIVSRELQGEKFSTGRVAVSWRKSTKAEVTNEAVFLDWAETGHEQLLRYQRPEVDKVLLKNALLAGETIPGAELVTRQNMSIK